MKASKKGDNHFGLKHKFTVWTCSHYTEVNYLMTNLHKNKGDIPCQGHVFRGWESWEVKEVGLGWWILVDERGRWTESCSLC